MKELVLNEEQEILRRTAAAFVAEHAPVGRIRKLRDAEDPIGFSLDLWKEMAGLGWAGMVLPEDHGGLGLGLSELVIVLEELGSTLSPEPFLSTILLGANTLLLGGSEEQRATHLPRIATGEEILALAHHEAGARHHLHRVATRAEPISGGGFRISGEKDMVLDGLAADWLVVSARTAGKQNDRDGIGLFLVDPSARGVKRTAQRLLDSRIAAIVRLDGVEVPATALIGPAGGGGAILENVVDRALVGLSAEMLGGMRRAFEQTVAYLKEREQFGVRIGSFQALKHRAAEMFVELELARSVVMAAARAIDEGSPEAAKLAALAKARLSDGFVHIANEAIQMHGGIGMTDEHDIGLYLKRARAAEQTLGDATHHRDRYAALEGY